MEDNKRIFKFFDRPGEDYQLWAAHTQAALCAKEVEHVIENDVLAQGTVDSEAQKKPSTACAIIIQGLGDKPMRLCLGERNDPFKMWKRVGDRHAVSNTATRVQLQSILARLAYSGQVMGDYVDSFEDVFNRLAGMGSAVSEELQVAMFLSSFGDLNRSKFGHAISSLQNVQDALSWETATARLLQAYDDAMWHADRYKGSSSKLMIEDGQALIAGRGLKKKPFYSNRKGFRAEKRRCYECREIGHLARNCPKKANDKDKHRSVGKFNVFNDSNDGFGTNLGTASAASLLMAVSDTVKEVCFHESSEIDNTVNLMNDETVNTVEHAGDICNVGDISMKLVLAFS